MDLITLVKELGPYVGLMFFFIWRDYRREEQLVKQITELQKFIRDELMELIDRTNNALNEYKNGPKS